MQKKIIALAVAAVASSAAFAQSNVTVYGVADMYVANVGTGTNATATNGTTQQAPGGQKVTAVNQGGLSGSRIGFKGVEDLGGGTKALFTQEFGSIAMDNGATNGMASSRQTFVGLTGDYGTAIAGRLQSLAYNHNAAFNPTFGTAVDTQQAVVTSLNALANSTTTTVNAASNLAVASQERLDNAIAYVAPSFGGVTLAAAHTTNAAAADTIYNSSVKASEVSAMYNNGPLAIGGVYRTVHRLAATGDNSFGLGASYDFGVAKVFVNTANSKATNASVNDPLVQASKYSMTQYGAVVPVSAKGAVIASIASGKRDGGNDAEGNSLNDLRSTTASVVYKHTLSARTALYAGLAQNSANDNTQAALAGVQSTAGGKVNVVFSGINHSF